MTATPIPKFDPQRPGLLKVIRELNTPWKMKLFFLQRLPSCWFWGVKVKYVDPDRAQVTIPFKWRTQNPFRSTYFAALSGAAELSTGLLAMIALHGRGQISMLITHVEAEFVKKADGRTTFSCDAGPALRETIQRAIDSGNGETIRVASIGRNEAGVEVCRVYLTWSFKVKSNS
jgi:hypothetical protein